MLARHGCKKAMTMARCAAQQSSQRNLRLAVLGSTGDTGKPFTEKALEQGHEVTAIIRGDPAKAAGRPGLTTVQGDVFDAASMAPLLEGQDAVISCLGFPKTDGEIFAFSESMVAIVDAMKRAELRRLVTISAWYTDPVARVGQPMFDHMWSKVPGLPATLDDEGRMEQVLERSKADIDFTSVRGPTLTWDPPSGLETEFEDAMWLDGYPLGCMMPRDDVAAFMLKTLEGPQWFGRSVAIGIRYSEAEAAAAMQRLRAHMQRYHEGDIKTK